MRNLLLAAALTLALSGCAEFQKAYNALTGATISPSTVYIAANAFDAVEQTATNYLKLPACSGSSGPVCRSAAAVKAIVPAVRSGRIARNQLEAQINASGGGAPISTSLYQTLVGATNSLRQIFAQYGIQ